MFSINLISKLIFGCNIVYELTEKLNSIDFLTANEETVLIFTFIVI